MNYSSQDNRFKGKILLFWVSVFVLILLSQMFYLQVIHYQLYDREADKNRIRLVPIDAPRGLIKDRKNNVLAANENSYTISITPYRIPGRKESLRKLCRIFDLDTVKYFEMGEPKFSFKPIPLLRNVDFKKVCIIEEHKESLPGIIIQRGLIRRYPYKDIACHSIGYLREISETELAKLKDKGYSFGDLIGRAGLESMYEHLLRGEDGYKYIEVNAYEREMREILDEKTKLPVPGNDLNLSIDIKLQKKAKELLLTYPAGSLVAIDVKSGEVLTLANCPGYDLNILSGDLLEKDWIAIRDNKLNPLFNRSISSRYPPGSPYKIVTSAAAIELLGTQPYTTLPISCKGGMEFGDRFYRCWLHSGHGTLNLISSIAQSCDVYFYQLGDKLGFDNLHDYALRFHLGKKTGIDLAGEKKGLIPDRKFYVEELNYKRPPRGLLLNLSIGQGEILVTPLQMAFMMALVANNGKMHRPHLLKSWTDSKTDSVVSPAYETVGLDLKKETLEILQDGMYQAVHGPFATGHRASVPGMKIAGKTGSAEHKKHEDTHSWFTGYAPYHDPQIAFACIVEKAGHGGSIAAPIIGEFLKTYFDTLGYRRNE